jgi:UDP-N-acetylglucosamine 2-epimerase (non-hydrolysing)
MIRGRRDLARVMVVLGTRPEAVKLAPVVRALKADPDLGLAVVVTAQHRTMLDQVLDLFEIVPDVDLDVIQPNQTLSQLTARCLAKLDTVVEEMSPDVVLVQGDTTSTLVGALCAFYHRTPVVHLEAGLRTGNRLAPFPEEVNRRLVTRLTDLHLAATAPAKLRLMDEGVLEEDIVVTGNTVVDAFLWALDQPAPRLPEPLADLEGSTDTGPPTILVTAHRRESWGPDLVCVGQALRDIASARPDVVVVLPLHLNPVVRASILPQVAGIDNIRVVDPLGYLEFVHVLRRAELVLTDSGGVQEEAPSVGTPVLVMRNTTERLEAVLAGTARLVGTDRRVIVETVLGLLRDRSQRDAMAASTNPFGDGLAAARVVGAVRHLVLGDPRPSDFCPRDAPTERRATHDAGPSDSGLDPVGAC